MTAARLDLDGVVLWTGDARAVLAGMPSASVDCVVTSPPYWRQRDYGVAGQLGLEDTVDGYVTALADVFDQLARILKPTGTCWLNLGDSYASAASRRCSHHRRLDSPANAATTRKGIGVKRGLPAKNLAGVPWRVALELQNRGWILRSEIIWHKPNAIPESVTDRPARRHEHLFLLTRYPRYYFNLDAIREPYTGDRPLSRRARRTGRRPNAIARPWPPPSSNGTSVLVQPPRQNLRPGRRSSPAIWPGGTRERCGRCPPGPAAITTTPRSRSTSRCAASLPDARPGEWFLTRSRDQAPLRSPPSASAAGRSPSTSTPSSTPLPGNGSPGSRPPLSVGREGEHEGTSDRIQLPARV